MKRLTGGPSHAWEIILHYLSYSWNCELYGIQQNHILPIVSPYTREFRAENVGSSSENFALSFRSFVDRFYSLPAGYCPVDLEINNAIRTGWSLFEIGIHGNTRVFHLKGLTSHSRSQASNGCDYAMLLKETGMTYTTVSSTHQDNPKTIKELKAFREVLCAITSARRADMNAYIAKDLLRKDGWIGTSGNRHEEPALNILGQVTYKDDGKVKTTPNLRKILEDEFNRCLIRRRFAKSKFDQDSNWEDVVSIWLSSYGNAKLTKGTKLPKYERTARQHYKVLTE